MNSQPLTKQDLIDVLKPYAKKQDLEDSSDEVMRSCQVQFSSIDKQFTEVHRKFNEVYRRFDKIDTRLDSMDTKLDHLIVFMKGHEKRITRIERHLEFA